MKFGKHDKDWLTSKPIAHRGLHDNIVVPENSLAAFEESCLRGYPIELDVRLLADDTVVVFHDKDLYRMTGMVGALAEHTTSAIRSARLIDSNETIPTLEDAIELIAGRVPVLIEIKKERLGDDKLEAAVLKTVESYTGAFAVQSFNPKSLLYIKSRAPQVVRGQLACRLHNREVDPFTGFVLRNMLCNPLTAPDFVAYDIDDMPSIPTALTRFNKTPLIAWTVRAPDQTVKAIRCADNYIFEGFTP